MSCPLRHDERVREQVTYNNRCFIDLLTCDSIVKRGH